MPFSLLHRCFLNLGAKRSFRMDIVVQQHNIVMADAYIYICEIISLYALESCLKGSRSGEVAA